MAGVFHSYDIRGLFGTDIDSLFAQKLAVAFLEQYRPKIVVVGFDERIGSEVLSRELVNIFLLHHVKVIDIGLCTTPMVWHAVNMHKSDGGIMVTASHNPKEYVGFKLCSKFALPIGYDTGLKDIEGRMNALNMNFIPGSAAPVLSEQAHYLAFSQNLVKYMPDQTVMRVVADCSNSAVAPILISLFAGTRHELILINEIADGNFPGHEPNPLVESTTVELSKRVVDEKADFGVIFDGDADRVVFVDENGNRIRPDLVTAILGRQLIKRDLYATKGKHEPIILADLRSSKAVEEIIRENGGQLYLTKVGRPHIISQLKSTKGLFAGELSGHYYYHDFYCCDDGVRTLLEIMQILCEVQQKLSHVISEVSRYVNSGETNLIVKDAKVVLDAVKQEYDVRKPQKVMNLDGLSIYFENFWFNIRTSNTEPLLRVNIEADEKPILDKEFACLMLVIKRFM